MDMHISNKKRFIYIVSLIVILLWLLGFVSGFYFGDKSVVGFLIGFAIVVWIGFSLISLFQEFEYSFLGIKGEATVSTYLETLYRKGVRCLDNIDFKLNRGDVDHVVVSPSGVWTVETKNTKNIFLADRSLFEKEESHFLKGCIRQAHAEAYSVRDFLSKNGFSDVPVNPILVFADTYAMVNLGYTPVQGVYVIGKQGLKNVIVDNPKKVLSEDKIDQLVELFGRYQQEW